MATVWTANTSLSAGDIIAPTSGDAGLFFKVTAPGTTGSSEPTWAKSIGQTVYDNNVQYVSFSATFSDLQPINPSNIIELFQLELDSTIHGVNTTYYWHNGVSENYQLSKDASNLIFNNIEYTRMPIEASGFEFNGKQLPRPKLAISNILGTFTTILSTLPQGLEGAKVTRIRTLERYIDHINFKIGDILLETGSVLLQEDDNYMIQESADNPHGTPDPTATFPNEVYFIDRKTMETRDIVQFELAASFDLHGVKLPKRQVLPSDFPGIGSFYS